MKRRFGLLALILVFAMVVNQAPLMIHAAVEKEMYKVAVSDSVWEEDEPVTVTFSFLEDILQTYQVDGIQIDVTNVDSEKFTVSARKELLDVEDAIINKSSYNESESLIRFLYFDLNGGIKDASAGIFEFTVIPKEGVLQELEGHTFDTEFKTTTVDGGEYVQSITVKVSDDEEKKLIPKKPHKVTNVVSGVHVYWSSVEGRSRYGVWRSETGENGTYKWLGNPEATHFTDTKVESGKTYHYKITSYDAETKKHSRMSDAIAITYVATPDITERSNVTAGVAMKWEKVEGATGYAIYRKSFSGSDAWSRITTISGNETFEWTDTTVGTNNGSVYRYTIRALAGDGMNILSGCRNVGRTMVRLTDRELKSAVVSDTTSVKCVWLTTTQATGYEVRFVSEDGEEKIYTVGNYKTGTKTFTGLTEGKTYQVQVRSYKEVENVGGFYSAWSNAVTVTLEDKPLHEVLPVPAKPHKITNVVSGVHVYWTAIDGVEKYGLWRSETGIDGTYKWIANPTAAHFTDTKVESGKTYYYKVTAMDAPSNTHGAMSEPIGVTYVATPDITNRRNVTDGIALGWQKIEGATGYAIYRKSYDGTDAWARIATIEGNDTFTYTDTSVSKANGTVYRYTIRALAGSDRKTLSGCRNTGRTMTRLTDRAISSVTAVDATSAKCTWTTTAQATGYEIMFVSEAGDVTTFTVGNYKTGVKTFKGLTNGVTYTVQVRSYKAVAGVGTFYSAWSEDKSVTMP